MRLRAPVAQRFHAPATKPSPNGLLNGVKRRVDGSVNRDVLPRNDDAWQAAQDNLDGADLVDPATWSIQVGYTDADPLDGCRELPELAELATDIGMVVLGEFHANRSHVRRRGNFSCGVAQSFVSVRKRRLKRAWNYGFLLLISHGYCGCS